jgi:hypothetical protein
VIRRLLCLHQDDHGTNAASPPWGNDNSIWVSMTHEKHIDLYKVVYRCKSDVFNEVLFLVPMHGTSNVHLDLHQKSAM